MTNDLLPWRHARALSRLPHEFKGALAWRGDGAHRVGWTIAEAAETPLAVIRESALIHNAARMRDYCQNAGFLLAPHAKTTMSPELIEYQVQTGAWAFAVATAYQARRAMDFGARRIMLAAEVIDHEAIATAIKAAIERAWEAREGLNPGTRGEPADAVRETLARLDRGEVRADESRFDVSRLQKAVEATARRFRPHEADGHHFASRVPVHGRTREKQQRAGES